MAGAVNRPEEHGGAVHCPVKALDSILKAAAHLGAPVLHEKAGQRSIHDEREQLLRHHDAGAVPARPNRVLMSRAQSGQSAGALSAGETASGVGCQGTEQLAQGP